MARNTWIGVALLATAVTVALAAASGVRAAPAAGAVCPTFSKYGLTFRWSVVGSHFTCASAKPVLVRLLADRVRNGFAKAPLRNGPKGYHCYVEQGTKHHAVIGLCYLGTLKFPKSGFQWFGS